MNISIREYTIVAHPSTVIKKPFLKTVSKLIVGQCFCRIFVQAGGQQAV